MKITKAQWDGFWKLVHSKSEHFYYDDSDIDPAIDEPETRPDEVFTVATGELCHGGPQEQSFEIPGVLTRTQVTKAIEERMNYPIVSAIRRYLGSLTETTLAVKLPRDREDDFRRLVSELGGSIIS